ncbi:MAG: MFS transporter, partial [Tannerella sp.]|nr:MFS transporter [Tannerella sp.]
LFGTLLLCVGLIAFVIYCGMDKRLDSSLGITRENSAEAGFQIKDLKLVLTNKGFWLIALLCVLFYSGVFPFLKFAATLMQDKYNVSPEYAGLIPSLLPFGTILLTPLFGNVYDRIGKGATLMIIGSVMMIAVHALFAAPILNVWWFAIIEIIVLGIAFSLVPSAMWPSVPKIIPQHLLGSAYALIFYVQNIGLALVPALIGWVLGKYGTTVTPQGVHYNYTYPMCVFTLFGILAVVVALLLKREDKKKGYGLEQPNIKK